MKCFHLLIHMNRVGDNMKKIIKENKVLVFLLSITILSIIGGIIFHATLQEEDKLIIVNNINELIKENKESLIENILYTNITTSIIWLLGISIIGIIIVILLYCFKCFIYSFELISFITTLKIKKILFIIIYFLPKTINLILLFYLSYFSIFYSIYLFKFIFLNKNINFKNITKKYMKILLISIILNALNSFINYYVIYKMLKINF